MKSETILKQLSIYLSAHDVERLRLNLVLKGSIIMCLAISDITKKYTGTQNNEKEVSRLLSALCKNHFRNKDSSTLPTV